MNEKFKEKQTGGTNLELPWGEEFKNILKEEKTVAGDWDVTKQEWKDCKVGTGSGKGGAHVESYCGYVEFKRGNAEYKLKASYTWKPGMSKNQWDVIIVKKNGNNVQCYDKTKSNWEAKNNNWEQHFNGEEGWNGKGSSHNAWTNIGCTSISIEK